jgi:hypothetical protein
LVNFFDKLFLGAETTHRQRSEEAKTIAADARIQAKNDGVKSFDIRDDLRRDAKAAARLLEPLGASILDAARFYAKHLEQQRSMVIRLPMRIAKKIKLLLVGRSPEY